MTESIEPATPVVSAIPPPEEMWKVYSKAMFEHGLSYRAGMQAIHALVASRVVVQKPCIFPVVEEPPFKIDDPDKQPLDPLKAIVEILDLWFGADSVEAADKLAALKRSLETGSGE